VRRAGRPEGFPAAPTRTKRREFTKPRSVGSGHREDESEAEKPSVSGRQRPFMTVSEPLASATRFEARRRLGRSQVTLLLSLGLCVLLLCPVHAHVLASVSEVNLQAGEESSSSRRAKLPRGSPGTTPAPAFLDGGAQVDSPGRLDPGSGRRAPGPTNEQVVFDLRPVVKEARAPGEAAGRASAPSATLPREWLIFSQQFLGANPGAALEESGIEGSHA
jgi:hypothetical protein